MNVAQVGNSSVITAVGAHDGRVLFYFQPIGGGPWTQELVIEPNATRPPVGAFTAASVAQVGNSSVIAAVGADGSVWFLFQPIGSGGWRPELVAAPTNSPNSPPPFIAASIAQVGNSSVIAAVSSDGSLWFYWQTIGTGPWNPELVAAATSTSSPVTAASIAHVGNSAVIAAVHQDGTLSFYWQTIGATGPWNQEPVPVSGPNNVSSASVAQVGNSSVIAAVHQDGTLSFYWQTIGGGPWNTEPVPGPNTISSASVAHVGNSAVIAAVGADGSLWFDWQTIGAAGWNLEAVAPAGSVLA